MLDENTGISPLQLHQIVPYVVPHSKPCGTKVVVVVIIIIVVSTFACRCSYRTNSVSCTTKPGPSDVFPPEMKFGL